LAQELDTNMKREEEDLSKGRMFFYTDGFPETKKNGKEIGEEGLIEQIKLSITRSAQETTNNIMDQAIFNPKKLADDMTFMTLGPLRSLYVIINYLLDTANLLTTKSSFSYNRNRI